MSVLYRSAAGVQAFGHSGSDGTWAYAWPAHDLMILYFTQSRGQATGIRLETEIDRWLVHAEAQPAPEVVARYAPYLGWYRASFQSALGTYQDEEFAVVLHNDRLALDVPGQFIFQLRDSTLNGRWYFEIESQLSVVFDHDGAGTVTGLRFYEPGQMFRLPRTEKLPSSPPRFADAEWLGPAPGGVDDPAYGVRLLGMPGCRYVIEQSGDLREWTPLQTNVLGGSRLGILDRGVGGTAMRFYRARAVSF